MDLSKLNKIWEELQKSESEPSLDHGAESTNTFFNKKPKWNCNASCNSGCRMEDPSDHDVIKP